MPKNGVIFIAAGAAYARAATEAARSVRVMSPSLNIDLFTDHTNLDEGVFDRVHRVDNPHARSKVDYLHMTRFERTLYLDTDIRVVADISDMFGLLDRFDIALAHAHDRNRDKTKAVWRTQMPEAFPQLNGGVILFKSSPPVLDLLRAWQESYHSAGFKKDQVTLRELLWLSDLRLHVLPPEYNIRYKKYLKVWDEEEAIPRILHFKKFHRSIPRARSSTRVIPRIRNLLGRLKIFLLEKSP